MSKELIDKYNGEVPSNREELENLAGVGRKTANVVLNVWFNQPALAVDTHVMRISKRLGFSKGKTPLAIENDLVKILPEKYIIKANHWMVLFGRYVCKAQKPQCSNCPIFEYCNSKDKII
jgi:endonuclease-3